MKPDPSNHNPDPKYVRRLIRKTGLSDNAVAKRLGVHKRTMRFWLAGTHEIPYHAQFALECLAEPDNV